MGITRVLYCVPPFLFLCGVCDAALLVLYVRAEIGIPRGAFFSGGYSHSR